MIIHFSPIRMDAVLDAAVQDDVLVVNGQAVDPAAPASDWIISSEMIDGTWHVTLLLPHGPAADPSVLFPVPEEVTEDGPVALPGQGTD